MAEKIGMFPGGLPGRGVYPWDQWLDGGAWKLVPGKDFRSTPEAFRGAVFSAARTRGLRVKTRMADGAFYLQCMGKR